MVKYELTNKIIDDCLSNLDKLKQNKKVITKALDIIFKSIDELIDHVKSTNSSYHDLFFKNDHYNEQIKKLDKQIIKFCCYFLIKCDTNEHYTIFMNYFLKIVDAITLMKEIYWEFNESYLQCICNHLVKQKLHLDKQKLHLVNINLICANVIINIMKQK